MVAGTVSGAVGVEGADWDIRFGAQLQRNHNLEKKTSLAPSSSPMVKQEGGKVRSAYLMADLPEGASVPYMPMAHSREHIPPALGDVDHMNTLSRELMPADTVRSAPYPHTDKCILSISVELGWLQAI